MLDGKCLILRTTHKKININAFLFEKVKLNVTTFFWNTRYFYKKKLVDVSKGFLNVSAFSMGHPVEYNNLKNDKRLDYKIV